MASLVLIVPLMGPRPLLQNSATNHFPPQPTSSLSCSCLLNLRKPLPSFRHACHQISRESVRKFTLCVGNGSSLITSPAISTETGDSISKQSGFCKVIWIIEADMADDDLLFLIGESEALGCWNPEMAILMSPTDSANLWKAEAMIDYGVNVKYNYLIKKETWTTSDIIWRPGPDFSVSVPTLQIHYREVVVRDLWMRFSSKSSFDHSWTSWMDEDYLRTPLSPPAARNEDERMHCHNGDQLLSKLLLADCVVKDTTSYSDEDIICDIASESENDLTYSVRYQPLEEPWLLVSNLSVACSESDEISSPPNSEADLLNEVQEAKVQQHQQIIEKLLPEKEISLISKQDLVSSIILINSSLCTMQRIAVLEDEELVELLLEPVKSDVQCDSVYLGLVTKLVPHMGGAFVNIGSSRPSLMDIKRIREPFIFPPFRRKGKEKFLNGEKESTSHDDVDAVVDLRDDAFEEDSLDSSPSFHDYDEEHEIEDEFDAPDMLGDKTNGSLIYHGEQDIAGEDSMHSLDKKLEGVNVAGDTYSHESDLSNLQHPESTKKKFSGENRWAQVQKGTKVVVQVVKEGLGTKGPTLTAYPKLRSRFWILLTRCNRVGVSKKISGVERTRLKVIAKTLQPRGFGVTVRTVASGHSLEELQKDLEGLLSTWENIMEHAKSAALAADEGVEGSIPVILHRAMGQTLSVVQDYFTDKVKRFVVDSARTYHEVTNYLQDIAPDLCNRVELYSERVPLFDKFKIEEEINNILSKRVPLANGGSLVIEQTEALVSIDVNGGHGMLGQATSQEKAVLEVNLAAAKQIARELRLRDIGGIIVVDFIDMIDDANKRLVYEEVKKAVERDRSMVKVSELSRHGLMEITRKRVRPSVTFMISEPCSCCHATGRVEALETSFAKIEQEICRLLAMMDQNAKSEDPKSWPRFLLMVDHIMCNYLTSGKRTRLATLTSSLKVWILLKVNRGFTRGAFEVRPLSDDKANKTQQISMLRPTDGATFSSTKKVTLIPVKKWKGSNK